MATPERTSQAMQPCASVTARGASLVRPGADWHVGRLSRARVRHRRVRAASASIPRHDWEVDAGSERERLAATFDQAARLYERARPEYPDELYERLLAATELPADAHLLEVGCATGKATTWFAERGFRVTCIERGRALAAALDGF